MDGVLQKNFIGYEYRDITVKKTMQSVYAEIVLGTLDSGGYMTETIKAFLKGFFPCAVEGGYDFVDVRDVADGIIKCIEKGKSGGVSYAGHTLFDLHAWEQR